MSNEVTQRVISVICKTQRLPPERVSAQSTFEELGFDSLDAVSILFALEEEFKVNIPDDDSRQIRSVGQVIEGIERLLNREASAS